MTRAETSFPFSFLSFLSLSFYHPLVPTGETFEARFTFGALSIHFKSFVCRFETIFCQCTRDASPLQFPDERKLGNWRGALAPSFFILLFLISLARVVKKKKKKKFEWIPPSVVPIEEQHLSLPSGGKKRYLENNKTVFELFFRLTEVCQVYRRRYLAFDSKQWLLFRARSPRFVHGRHLEKNLRPTLIPLRFWLTNRRVVKTMIRPLYACHNDKSSNTKLRLTVRNFTKCHASTSI